VPLKAGSHGVAVVVGVVVVAGAVVAAAGAAGVVVVVAAAGGVAGVVVVCDGVVGVEAVVAGRVAAGRVVVFVVAVLGPERGFFCPSFFGAPDGRVFGAFGSAGRPFGIASIWPTALATVPRSCGWIGW
jgi:hypothetical protein